MRAFSFLLLGGFLYGAAGWLSSFPIRVRRYTVTSDKIKSSVRIAVVSDLHSTRYGKNQRRLIEKLKSLNCDLIAMPGDIIDDHKPLTHADAFLRQIGKIAPAFYCTGNHENIDTLLTLKQVKKRVREQGIQVLDRRQVKVKVNGVTLILAGIDDPRKYARTDRDREEEKTLMKTFSQIKDQPEFTVLLAHRPERADLYQSFGFDLILSGHAHGGQVRIPGLINGLYAPNQGWFPKRAGGCYQEGKSTLVVSRGLCQRFPLPRIWNPVEIAVVELNAAQ